MIANENYNPRDIESVREIINLLLGAPNKVTLKKARLSDRYIAKNYCIIKNSYFKKVKLHSKI